MGAGQLQGPAAEAKNGPTGHFSTVGRFGLILDGRASGLGNSTRGARYNSALRYVESSAWPCLAIVVSEDGLVDVLTKENLAEEAA